MSFQGRVWREPPSDWEELSASPSPPSPHRTQPVVQGVRTATTVGAPDWSTDGHAPDSDRPAVGM